VLLSQCHRRRETLFGEDVLHHAIVTVATGFLVEHSTALARRLATYPARPNDPNQGETMSRVIGYGAVLVAAIALILELVIG